MALNLITAKHGMERMKKQDLACCRSFTFASLVITAFFLIACAPKVEPDSGKAGESTTGTATAVSADDAATTMAIEMRAQPAPFKLPFPDELHFMTIFAGIRERLSL